MDRISKEKMLEWLTTTAAPRERAMINNGSFNRIADYRVTQLRRQIDQPSLGDLGKLPMELLCMVFGHLSCNDLEALRFCSTGAHFATLAFPLYRTLCKHAPAIITILKKTRLARSFSIAKIYETLASTQCTTCDQFGGYVFLPSFSRCCLYCAETLLKFMPISRDYAKSEFGVKGKILGSQPQLRTIQGCYSDSYGDTKLYRQHLILFSRELVEKMSDPRDTSFIRYGEGHVSKDTIKLYQRYMALTPLPCFIPTSASTENGVYCTGCALRAKEHPPSYGLGRRGHSHIGWRENTITKAEDIHCWMGRIKENCILNTAQDRLYDSRHVYSHLQDCAAAQALLKYKWTELQKEISRTDT